MKVESARPVLPQPQSASGGLERPLQQGLG